MAETRTPADIAERVQKRRQVLMTIFPVLFLFQQVPFWIERFRDAAAPLRTVDKLQVSAYVFWALSLLVLLATGGGLGRSKAVRALLSDEVTRDNRAKAYAAGFWSLIIASTGLYVLSLFVELTPMHILHTLLSVGVYVSCITFVSFERRAARA